jgi:molybdopterin molybdotransferase
MLTVDEAIDLVRTQTGPLPARFVPLAESRECILAEDVTADADQPPFDKSLVDGYALRLADLAGGSMRLCVGETILAGQVPTRALGPREAALVMTGAPVPPGTDGVVMHEQTQPQNGGVLVATASVQTGQNLLRRGRICRTGDLILAKGARLTPPRLGLLASVGKSRVRLVPRPRVAIVPTGDELVEIDQTPGPGQIRNSNAIMLEALARQEGAAPLVFPIARDEPAALERSLVEGLELDVLMINGGVSAGQRDLVPAALERLGARRVFHKVRVKPGKPLWFGVGPARGDRPPALVFGLPGNPVSSLVGFLLFVQPCLQVLAGNEWRPTQLVEASLAGRFTHRGDRPTYHPARLVKAEGTAHSVGAAVVETLDWAGSADLLGLAGAEGFAVFPAGDRVFEAGEIVRFLPLR